MTVRVFAAALLLVLLGWPQQAAAQAAGSQPAGGSPSAGASGTQSAGTATAGTQDHTPEPYAPGEFPGWMSDVWRSEAVFVGVFPLSLFVTLEVYDSYRYVTNNFNTTYAPWPFGSGAASTYSASETLWLAVSALSLSFTVAGIDFILGRIHDTSPAP